MTKLSVLVGMFFLASVSLVFAQTNPFLADEQSRAVHPLYEANPFKSFPECSEAGVLAKIEKQFRYGENRTWKRGFLISEINGVRTLRTRDRARPALHSRRYCNATVHFTDGRRSKVHCLIEEGAGFVGFGFNVAYCIDGLDPWRVSDGFCRTVRPF